MIFLCKLFDGVNLCKFLGIEAYLQEYWREVSTLREQYFR